ncbi:dTMP kinase [candidate division KSB1 bacterium]|nr:dTMP kinase [candidate division KSB1 bacterium]
MPGNLITFEGIDFSGKSVQANLLHGALKDRKLPVLILREPGGTEISEKIRSVLLDNANHKMSAMTEVLLYSAARAQMVRENILPNLEKGTVVICDRYFDSTTAYQGFGRRIDLDFIKKLNNFATEELVPDLTFLIDLDAKIALQRTKTALDRLEKEDSEFHQRVRKGYLEIARSNPDRFVVIDGTQSIEAIQDEIFMKIKLKLPL